jgi:exodeoxyribonuclease VII small subunit
MSKKKELSFEESAKILKDIVSQIENDDVSLDVAIDLFSKGVDAAADCKKMLEEANGKITELKKSKNGKLVEEILNL